MRHVARSRGADARLRLVHTSDLHLFANRRHEDDLAMVRTLAASVAALGADVVAVAGDLFDHNRVPDEPAADLLAALAAPGIPIVVLPGNHDPLTAESVYRRVERPPNVFVLGLNGRSLGIAGVWSITGRAHLDYGDFSPLDDGDADLAAASDARESPQPSGRVVLGHGHYDIAGESEARHRPGWLITDQDLDRLTATYVGLGHWDRAYEVRPSSPPTYYSGSPWLAGSVNVVDLDTLGRVAVHRAPIGEGIRGR
jgi:DNA repair exonuclease SbcCD nuclease subunit